MERRKRDEVTFEATTDVGKRLDAVRAEKGWTIGEVARRAGVDSGNLTKLRLGDKTADRIGVAHAFKIADALEVEARWLFLGEGPKTALTNSKVVEAQKLIRAAGELLQG